MPAPTNPKKQSLMPASPLRRALRAAGHHLSPVVQVGKEGATPAVAGALDEQLLAHELIKVKVGSESPEDRFELAAWLAALPGAQVAQVIGRVVLLYRKHPDRPRFELLTPAEARASEARAKAKADEALKPARSRRGRGGSRKWPAARGADGRPERRPGRPGPVRGERPAHGQWAAEPERSPRKGKPSSGKVPKAGGRAPRR